MRAMDDVKESCRAAAAATMRTLQSVSLRLADPAATAAADAAQAVDMLLPFLLDRCARQPLHSMIPDRMHRTLACSFTAISDWSLRAMSTCTGAEAWYMHMQGKSLVE